MLTELRIENFAIIQHLELRPGAGLVIFTGETGAGKSIILDALLALVGGRVEPTMVRQGEERAILEASFNLPQQNRSEMLALLASESLDDGDSTISLGREIRANGRSVARINGRAVNVALLKELGNYLVDIHGQSEHLSLLDVRSHLGLLDRYASSQLELEAYQQEFRKLHEIRKELRELHALEQETEKRIELLNFQAQEIEAARLQEGEEEELERERNRLANAEALAGTAQEALALLDEPSPESASITDQLGQVEKLLATLTRIDHAQAGLLEQLEEAATSLSEISRDLRAYLDGIEFNPKRLEFVETRLELIHQLKRKYGGSVASALAYGKGAREQLEKVQHAGERIAELQQQEAVALLKVQQTGEVLSLKRHQAAEQMGREVECELNDLSLAGAQFVVAFGDQPEKENPGRHHATEFKETGLDEVEFLIAPNPGEGLKPLVKIASGGETSRLMLALKNVLAKADSIPTLIFDEIDQGIGGRVGFIVGEKMWRLGRQHQVMCVTHLPQLAAFGDEHYQVTKQVIGDRTLTQVQRLDEEQRVLELAQMAGNISESNLTAARENLQQARKRQVDSR